VTRVRWGKITKPRASRQSNSTAMVRPTVCEQHHKGLDSVLHRPPGRKPLCKEDYEHKKERETYKKRS